MSCIILYIYICIYVYIYIYIKYLPMKYAGQYPMIPYIAAEIPQLEEKVSGVARLPHIIQVVPKEVRHATRQSRHVLRERGRFHGLIWVIYILVGG